MFNDLNANNQGGRPMVDDIFAETDKPSGVQSDIETHRVGLAMAGDSLPQIEMADTHVSGGRSYVKIIIIAGVIIAVLGGAYFTYSQFIKTEEPIVEAPVAVNKVTNNPVVTTKPEDSGFVTVVPGMGSSTTVNPVGAATSSQTSPIEPIATSTVIVESTVDSDVDGLTDVEEKISGTNSNVIDTDNDGLSDYEEVKIYRTNPLNADSDNDSYLDGAEVKSGYNPNGPGKLADIAPKN